MEFNIKFIKGEWLISIAVVGMILSLVVPIYLKINYGLNVVLMAGLIIFGFIFSFITAYFSSKRNEYFLIYETGLLTKKYGLVNWSEINSLHLVDNNEHEIFTIKFSSGKKITIPSAINNSENRKEFEKFKNALESHISDERGSNENIIQHSYAYDGKGWKILGFVFLVAVIAITFYVLFELIYRDMTAKKFGALALVYGSVIPMITRIFRKELFGWPKKAMKV